MSTLEAIIDSQYRDEKTYPKPKPRDEPRLPFYQRGRVEVVTVVVEPGTKSEETPWSQ